MSTKADSFIADNIEEILNKFSIDDYDYFETSDTIKLFKTMRELKKELNYIKLENTTYEYFLFQLGFLIYDQSSKTHSNCKISVRFQEQMRNQECRQSVADKIADKLSEKLSKYQKRVSYNLPDMEDYQHPSIFLKHLSDRSFMQDKITPKLNYTIKEKIALQFLRDIEKRLEEEEIKTYNYLRKINADNKENEMQIHELKNTIDRLKLAVNINEKMWSIQKFNNFCKNYIINGLSLISTLEVKLQLIKQKYKAQRAEIHNRKEYIGTYLPIDYHLLKMKCDGYKEQLKHKNHEFLRLHEHTGHIGLAISLQKTNCSHCENKLRNIEKQIQYTQNSIYNLNREIKDTESEITITNNNLLKFKQKLSLNAVPTIKQYMNIKEELRGLYDEEKPLNRKISLLKIQLKNAKRNLSKK